MLGKKLRLSVPGFMGLSGFAHPLDGQKSQSKESDDAHGEAVRGEREDAVTCR